MTTGAPGAADVATAIGATGPESAIEQGLHTAILEGGQTPEQVEIPVIVFAAHDGFVSTLMVSSVNRGTGGVGLI